MVAGFGSADDLLIDQPPFAESAILITPSRRASILACAAEKELPALIALFEAAVYREEVMGQEALRLKAQTALDTILDQKKAAWELALRECGK